MSKKMVAHVAVADVEAFGLWLEMSFRESHSRLWHISLR